MLPNEIIVAILGFVDLRTLARAKTSSRVLNGAAKMVLGDFMKALPAKITDQFTKLRQFPSTEQAVLSDPLLAKAVLAGMRPIDLITMLKGYQSALISRSLGGKDSLEKFIISSCIKLRTDILCIHNSQHSLLLISRFCTYDNRVESVSYCEGINADPRNYQVFNQTRTYINNYARLLNIIGMSQLPPVDFLKALQSVRMLL